MPTRMNKLSILVCLSLFIAPQVSFAAWWNPLDWFSFLKPKAEIQIVEKVVYMPATSTPDKDIPKTTDKPVALPKKQTPDPVLTCKQRVTRIKSERIHNANASDSSCYTLPEDAILSASECLEITKEAVKGITEMHKDWMATCEYQPDFVPYKWGDKAAY